MKTRFDALGNANPPVYEDCFGQVVLFFIAETADGEDNPTEYEEYAYIRWLTEVDEDDLTI